MSFWLLLVSVLPHPTAAEVNLTRYLLRPAPTSGDANPQTSEAVANPPADTHEATFPARAGGGSLSIEGEQAGLTIVLNGETLAAGERTLTLAAENTIRVTGAERSTRLRIRQPTPASLAVLGRIHFNTNVTDFESAREFYRLFGFDTISGFPDANTVAMARAIGIDTPTSYDGRAGGEPGGYLLHGELIGPGFSRGVIDLIEFTIPRNEAPPYPGLNHLGIVRAVFETSRIDADHATLQRAGVRFLSAPVTRADGVRFAMLTDPDGTFYELREVPGEPDRESGAHVHRIGAVGINVSDFERSASWYQMLGYEQTAELPSTGSLAVAKAMGFDSPFVVRGGVFTHREDGSALEIVQWLEPYDARPPYPLPINHIGIHRLALASDDIEADVSQLVAEGVVMISPITPCCSGPDAWGKIVAFRDPDGIVVELAEMPFAGWLMRLMRWLD